MFISVFHKVQDPGFLQTSSTRNCDKPASMKSFAQTFAIRYLLLEEVFHKCLYILASHLHQEITSNYVHANKLKQTYTNLTKPTQT